MNIIKKSLACIIEIYDQLMYIYITYLSSLLAKVRPKLYVMCTCVRASVRVFIQSMTSQDLNVEKMPHWILCRIQNLGSKLKMNTILKLKCNHRSGVVQAIYSPMLRNTILAIKILRLHLQQLTIPVDSKSFPFG